MEDTYFSVLIFISNKLETANWNFDGKWKKKFDKMNNK